VHPLLHRSVRAGAQSSTSVHYLNCAQDCISRHVVDLVEQQVKSQGHGAASPKPIDTPDAQLNTRLNTLALRLPWSKPMLDLAM
jgi:hypothetical protein